MQSGKQSKSRIGRIFSVALTVVMVAVAALIVWQRQYAVDMVMGVGYQPTPDMRTVENRLGLTSEGTRYFAASRPVLQSADQFNDSCGQQRETNNPIIGCYVAQRIYIYDIDDERLDGIKETTAAHELLHAAYERMPASEREAIDAEIRKVLRTIVTPELQRRLAYYQRTEPGEEGNELHSILGTEFSTLGPVLERHYAKYFTSRKSVVDRYNKYNKQFASVTDRLATQLAEINALTEQTNVRIAAYNTELAALDKDIAVFNSKAERGDFSSQSEFQSERNKLRARRQILDEKKAVIEASIAKVEQQTKEREGLTSEYESLSRSINSTLAPAPKL